jgi:hypothetical protein
VELLGGLTVGRQGREAERGGTHEPEVLTEPLGRGPELGLARLGQQHRELVPAKAAEDVRGPQVGGEGDRDPAQQGVAGRMTLGVVDGLEVVEVDHDQAQRAPVVAHVVRPLRLEALGEAATVQAARQRVRAREPRELAPLVLAVRRLGDAHHRGRDEQGGEDPDHVGLCVAREESCDHVGTHRHHAADPHGACRVGERAEDQRQEEDRGEHAARAAVRADDGGDDRDIGSGPGEEEVLAPVRAHDRRGGQPAHGVGAHQSAGEQRDDERAVRAPPGDEDVGEHDQDRGEAQPGAVATDRSRNCRNESSASGLLHHSAM